jgi:hypothetical protein
MVFLPPLYNQLSNQQGIGVESLFIGSISNERMIEVSQSICMWSTNLLHERMTIEGEKITLPNLLK